MVGRVGQFPCLQIACSGPGGTLALPFLICGDGWCMWAPAMASKVGQFPDPQMMCGGSSFGGPGRLDVRPFDAAQH